MHFEYGGKLNKLLVKISVCITFTSPPLYVSGNLQTSTSDKFMYTKAHSRNHL